MAKGNITKFLLTGVAGGAIALGGNIVYQNVNTHGSITSPTTAGSAQVSKVNVDVNTDTTAAVKKVSNAVVSVLNYQGSSSSSDSLFGGDSASNTTQLSSEGSGVIYKKDGNTAYIVTNDHVVAGAKSLEVLLSGGQKVTATLVGEDTYSDIAVLKIDAKYVKETATFANSDNITVGEPAIAVGSPLGSQFANTATEGIVSAKSRQVSMTNDSGQAVSVNAIQTDASINPGNSGGALINIGGQVIGITQSKLTTTEDGSTTVEGIGFAIPANDVVNIINKLERDGKVVRPALGVSMVALSSLPNSTISELRLPESVTSGVVVAQVQSGLPAANAGLKERDVITKVGDTSVSSSTDLQSALYKHNIGDKVKLTFYRDGKQQTAEVTLNKSSSDLHLNNSSSSSSSSSSNSQRNSQNSDSSNDASDFFSGN
ncbi:serine protease [Lactococcus termiticola]|uniref:Serine protease n=1 Tax=Lactococcus termiticola TaxID=2169526 RepID=A0A2R5HHL4_9LACT|nr:serine protease [Lactococcus termiticola]